MIIMVFSPYLLQDKNHLILACGLYRFTNYSESADTDVPDWLVDFCRFVEMEVQEKLPLFQAVQYAVESELFWGHFAWIFKIIKNSDIFFVILHSDNNNLCHLLS